MRLFWRRVGIVLLLLGTSIAIAYLITQPWWEALPKQATCSDAAHVRHDRDSPGFAACLPQAVNRFFERSYAESKDLAKAFLTLLTAVLVASITFSEKIVDVGNAKRFPVNLMITCWVLLIAAMLFTGAGLGTMALAAGATTFTSDVNFPIYTAHAARLFILACFAFGIAMVSLMAAGAMSLSDKRRKAQAAAIHELDGTLK
jgi:hypothetical protein